MELSSEKSTRGSQPPRGWPGDWLGDPMNGASPLNCNYESIVKFSHLNLAELRLSGCFLAVTGQPSHMLCLNSFVIPHCFPDRVFLEGKITGLLQPDLCLRLASSPSFPFTPRVSSMPVHMLFL